MGLLRHAVAVGERHLAGLVTPFGNIPLRSTFDGAKGIADHTVDDRPVRLTNGYSMAPADPLGETITATSGVLPLWTSVQGHQVFGIFDPTGAQVGSFDGVFTTTSDILGTYTQAILVTGNDGVNVGAGAGQVPPVGSVYNVVYAGADTDYVLYSSMPSAAGDVVTVEQVNSGTVQTSPRTFIDASEPPSTQPLSVSRGLTLVPVSPLQPAGINGLRPERCNIRATNSSTSTTRGARVSEASTLRSSPSTICSASRVGPSWSPT